MKRLLQNLGFVSTRPALLARGVANYGSLALGRPRLRLLDLELTHRCPCLCAQCYADIGAASANEELTVEEIAALVDEARSLGALQVLLSGGEPLVRKDLMDVISACLPSRMLVTLCTSGVGLTRERVGRLRSAGLGVIVFSVDSVEATVHDANRGIDGLHARVLGAAFHARSLGTRVIFNTVATKEKLRGNELFELAELARRHGATLNLTIPTPQGRWNGNETVVLEPSDRNRLSTVLKHANIRTDVDSSYGRRGCPAGVEKISIDPYGNARACPLLPAVWGNVRETSLRSVWSGLRSHPGTAERADFCPAADLEFRRRHPDLF